MVCLFGRSFGFVNMARKSARLEEDIVYTLLASSTALQNNGIEEGRQGLDFVDGINDHLSLFIAHFHPTSAYNFCRGDFALSFYQAPTLLPTLSQLQPTPQH